MADQNDPNTPLEELEPVDLLEVEFEIPEPPPEWGEQGQGEDLDPHFNAKEVPQNEGGADSGN